MKMAKVFKPELVRRFELLLWANTPKNWIIKTTYVQNVLYVSAILEIHTRELTIQHYQTIRRHFSLDVINNRVEDLWGLATDCVDEMKTDPIN